MIPTGRKQCLPLIEPYRTHRRPCVSYKFAPLFYSNLRLHIARNGIRFKTRKVNIHRHTGAWADSNPGCVGQSIYDLMSMRILFTLFECLLYCYKQSYNCVLCAAVSCGPATNAPANGQRSVSGTTYGSTVTYACNRGYTLQGNSRHTCLANGQWSGRAPTCNCKMLRIRCRYRYIWAAKFHQGQRCYSLMTVGAVSIVTRLAYQQWNIYLIQLYTKVSNIDQKFMNK